MLRGAVCKMKIRVKLVCLCLSDMSLVSYHFQRLAWLKVKLAFLVLYQWGTVPLTMAGGTDRELTEPLRIAEVSLSLENTAEVRKYTEQSDPPLIVQA